MKRLPIAFQGERGAFSEEAARKLAGANSAVLPCIRFEDVFRSLQEGRSAGAAVPIENTLAGSVHENYDHLVNFEFPIVGETSVRIVHNLIAPKSVAFSKIKRVFSHPVALNQCLDFFARNPQIERVPFYDTAGSVKMLMDEGLRDAGAIASAVAADIYGARILRRSIESDRQNFTRFFLLRTPEYSQRPRAHPVVATGPGTVENLGGFQHAEYPGRAVSRHQRFCAARFEPHQDRIAAVARETVGIPVLS
jgi:prephenate dehydratase